RPAAALDGGTVVTPPPRQWLFGLLHPPAGHAGRAEKMIKTITRMNTRVPRPIYTGSPFGTSSTAGSRTGVLIREVRRRVAPRPARGHATTATRSQGAPPPTSRG